MAPSNPVVDLILRWQDLHAQGQSVSPEALCAECPELLEQVRQRLQQLQSMDALIEGGKKPVAAVPAPAVDRNMLFGIMALQMDFISRDQLVAGMNAWVLEKSKPLSRILEGQGVLSVARRLLMDALVQEHLKQHNDNPQQSLAALGSIGSARQALESIADPDMQASLSHLPMARVLDASSVTLAQGPGEVTSPDKRFRILRPHAKGGLGEVFVADDRELHREVAVKTIHASHADRHDSRARFVLEAEITGRLEHPGIVPVYSLGAYPDGRPYYAMRFIKGDTLLGAIQEFHSKSPGVSSSPGPRAQSFQSVEFRQLLRRFLDVCNAMHYAHDRGVLHRDLKPGNIMLGKYGETLIVDWGLAKVGVKLDKPTRQPATDTGSIEPTLHPTAASGSAETIAGRALGTPAYMSPEQAEGRLDLLGPASNVYSLGATLYCVLTGCAPCEGSNVDTVLALIIKGDIAPPRRLKPNLPRPLEAICLKAMALRPGDRYVTPLALAKDLEHWLADEPVSAWREPWRVKAGRWMRRHKALMSAAAAALLVAMIAGSIGTVWQQNVQHRQATEQALREADEARKKLSTEASIRQVLDDAVRKRDHARKLTEDPDEWKAVLQEALADVRRAEALLANSSFDVSNEAALAVRDLGVQLADDEQHRQRAERLEKIRVEAATPANGGFYPWNVLPAYREEFKKASLHVETGDTALLAEQIRKSPICRQLLAALEDWAYWSLDSKMEARLLEIARRADPHPWRDRFRDNKIASDRERLEALAADPQTSEQPPYVLGLLGRRLAKCKGKADQVLHLAQESRPDDFWLNYDLAGLLRNQGRYSEAVSYYRAAVALRPKNGWVHLGLGSALHLQKDLPKAVAAFTRGIALDPKNAQLWWHLGQPLSEQKNWPAAIEAYRKAALLDASFPNPHLDIGLALQHQNDLAGAIESFKKAISVAPDYHLSYLLLGNALLLQQDPTAAYAAFSKAIACDSTNESVIGLQKAMVAHKDLLRIVVAMVEDSKRAPNRAAVYHSLGKVLEDHGDLRGAIAAFKKATELDPTNSWAWFQLGVLIRGEDLAAAIAAYGKSLAINPKDAQTHFFLAHALHVQKDHSKAIASYKKSLQLEPEYPNAWWHLGLAFRDQEDLPAAIVAFHNAARLAPTFASAPFDLGLTLEAQGNMPAAIAAFQKAIEVDPKFAIAHQHLAELERKLSDALQRAPASPSELLGLANLFAIHRKRNLDAVALFEKAFAAQTQSAENPRYQHRYNAACAAALSAAGKGLGVETLGKREQSILRGKALNWLEADLVARENLLRGKPSQTIWVQDTLRRWQHDPDLAGIRDPKELAKLPPDEQQSWQKLWARVQESLKDAESRFTETRHSGALIAEKVTKVHEVKMSGGITYVIDLESKDFDALLKLESVHGKLLAENDDIGPPNNRNARIVFKPTFGGMYRIVVSSFQRSGRGSYTLRIREFLGGKE